VFHVLGIAPLFRQSLIRWKLSDIFIQWVTFLVVVREAKNIQKGVPQSPT